MAETPGRKGTSASARSRGPRGPARGPPGDTAFPVVGIGASAGGLDACRKLVDALPAGSDLALILVQHLDPTHESMLVDLLAGHTSLVVQEAADGMVIEPEHLYVIPPGSYLSVGGGALHLSRPLAPHGARLPFDFLLHSLAEAYGVRAVGVVLSGTGADGSLGVKAIRDHGGLVIAQEPDEAGYDGMPRSAIQTGLVDLVLPVAEIPQALIKNRRDVAAGHRRGGAAAVAEPDDRLPEIIALVRTKSDHDFSLYKPGTLRRRVQRRAAMAATENHTIDQYVALLRRDDGELDLLAKDLLINVTSFFRDKIVFDLLARTVVPGLVHDHTADHPVRIWVAGCSTGEEAYSLVMLFREHITAAKLNVKLQVFASDIDPDAVAVAREGFYSKGIEAEVSQERLARFFTAEEHGYRVLPELRAAVVFTVQDVLADPPFSRIDLVSCRNLLIYLRPDAQAQVISLFHFALRDGGILLLGNSETVGTAGDRFEAIAKAERIYRHVGRSRPGELSFSMRNGVRVPTRAGTASRQAALADLCRRLVMETFAPAAVLINRKHECLYSLGRTDRYLRVPQGQPTHDLLALAPEGMRIKLRAAIQRARQDNARIVVAGGTGQDGHKGAFSISVQPVASDGEELLLICFVDEPKRDTRPGHPPAPQDLPRIAELEYELDATRAELQDAIRNLETATDEQKAINEEALSVNEEYQSTNEELLTSKEELQSLNEELTALNSQLQETLERQRTTSNDLQNILYSSDVATLFLDTELNIRFFTPATKALFNVIPSDVGRPIADLQPLASDDALLVDARRVLRTLEPCEREIKVQGGAWYTRRIQPYRAEDDGIEGVVVTFADITERRRTADALSAAKRQAELANVGKSRFLAAASHDLRQPLQTLMLLQELLTKCTTLEKAQTLIARLGPTLDAMSGMLNTLLDINQIEAGTIRTEVVAFPINDPLGRMRDEFTAQAQAQNLAMVVVPCSLTVRSDPRLLEQMLRNLISNALKYTKRGKVLLGCRRREGAVSLEVWDTGVGIPDTEIHAIFEEYHQLDNAARERSRGLGLGLAIVQRLAHLLRHRIRVRSNHGKGSMFAVEVPRDRGEAPPGPAIHPPAEHHDPAAAARSGLILVIEDDPDLSDALTLVLEDHGYRVVAADDGPTALERVERGALRPDLIIADYNLPNTLDGLQVTAKLRTKLGSGIPVIVLTGDISTQTLRAIARHDCTKLNKPVKLADIIEVIQRLLSAPRAVAPVAEAEAPPAAAPAAKPEAPPAHDAATAPGTIFVVDDDSELRETLRAVLEAGGHAVETYPTSEAFLAAYRPGTGACLLIDAYLPGMDGLELLRHLHDAGARLPAIMITGNSDVAMAVQAMKAGASDFIEKPVGGAELLAGIARALEQARDSHKLVAWRETAATRLSTLTPRQREIMDLVLAGHPSKNIAADLGISQRTVENHRASIMRRTGSKSLPALARLSLTAAGTGAEAPPKR